MAKGPNIDLRKKNNQNRILNIIKHNQNTSRFEIKKISKYSMSTVLSVVDDLLKSNYVVESGIGESTGGRKPTWLEVNPDAGYFIGIEFNSRFLNMVILNFSAENVYSKKIYLENNERFAERTIELIKRCITDGINFIGKSIEAILGIGLGVPGYVDNVEGVSIYYSQIDCWKNVQFKKEIEKEFGVKTYVENNVNVMVYAYKWLRPDLFGEDFIVLSIRAGIRMACVINNSLYKGKNNTAGEIGHLRVMGGNRICSCGKKGCLDTEVSERAIQIKILEGIERGRFKELVDMLAGKLEDVNIYSFIDSVLLGHRDSVLLFEEICEYLGDAISQVINVMNPSKIFLYGPITVMEEQLLKSIKQVIEKNSIFINLKDLQIKCSNFGDDLGAMGAAALVMQKEFEFI